MPKSGNLTPGSGNQSPGDGNPSPGGVDGPPSHWKMGPSNRNTGRRESPQTRVLRKEGARKPIRKWQLTWDQQVFGTERNKNLILDRDCETGRGMWWL